MARVKSGDGYWMITPPLGYKGKTYIGGRYVYEHRLFVEQKIGRLLVKGEVVDHIDGNKLNNGIENLQILNPISHREKHYTYKGDNVFCGICEKQWRVRPHLLKVRKMFFCSRKHYRTFVLKNNWGRKSEVPER